MAWLTPLTGWVVVDPSPVDAEAPEIFKTTNGGQSWVRIPYRAYDGIASFGKTATTGVSAFYFTDPHHGVLLASLGVGACQASFMVWTTNDGGKIWAPAGRIFGSDGPTGVTQYSPSSPMWVADGSCATSAIFLFQDGGGGWHQSTHPEPLPGSSGPLTAPAPTPPASVALLPGPAGVTLVAEYEDDGVSSTPAARIMETTVPGGSTSARTFSGPGSVQAMAFLTPSFGWLQTTRALYQTRDRGGAWTVIPMPPAIGDAIPLLALGGTPGNLVAWYASGPNLWTSKDDGRAWTAVPTPWFN